MNNKIRWQFLIVLVLGIVLIFIMGADSAMAGPGGIIKKAVNTFWGRVIVVAILLFFAPLIILYLLQRFIRIRRTRTELRKLGKHVPHFEWMFIKERIHGVFAWVHSAWDQKKMEVAGDFMTHWYMQNQQLILDKWGRDGVVNIVSDVLIKEIIPLHFHHYPGEPEKDRIVVEIDAEMRDYLAEKSSGKIVQGDKTLGRVTTVWSFLRENDQWVLNLIEDSETAEDYLKEPNIIPAAIRVSAV